MKKVLVVGGAGYIGSHTVRELSDNGYQVVVADSLIYGHREAVFTDNFYQVDLADKDALSNIFSTHDISAVIHFAAFAYVGESVIKPSKYYYNNVVNTLNLLDVMLKFNVKNIVFSSTCATYGEPLYTPIDESHLQNPVNPYGRSKLMIEHIFEDYKKAYGLNYVSLRYFNAAGCSRDGLLGESHSPETHLIPLVLKAIKGEIDNITVFGTDYDTPDGTCIRDYIHVEDLASAHKLALDKLLGGSESICLNLGTGVGTSVKEIINAAERVTQKKVPVLYGNRRDGDPAILFAAAQLAHDYLGWVPIYTSIDDIVETAWRWELNKRF